MEEVARYLFAGYCGLLIGIAGTLKVINFIEERD